MPGSAADFADGQVVSAVARYNLTLYKQYHAYRREQFPAEQTVPSDVRKLYLGDSPGIQTRTPEVRKLLGELRGATKHPWDLARSFAAWIPHNIKPHIGSYTSVTAALVNRLGDCAEMSAVFVALCRAAGIPARLVWVPNHNWAEFYLADKEGTGHWIPAHTACYFWFGWTAPTSWCCRRATASMCRTATGLSASWRIGCAGAAGVRGSDLPANSCRNRRRRPPTPAPVAGESGQRRLETGGHTSLGPLRPPLGPYCTPGEMAYNRGETVLTVAAVCGWLVRLRLIGFSAGKRTLWSRLREKA